MTYYPVFANITAITNATQAVATFDADHTFTKGQIVSFRVTKDFGMFEINQRRARVLNTTDDTITTDIDTRTWTPFTLGALNDLETTPPVCVPAGSGVIPELDTPEINILDSFDKRPN